MTTLDDGPPPIRLFPLFLKFLRFGCLAFGGPVAQIAMLRQTLVEEERWLSGPRFNRLLAVMQILPGPEAHELCVHMGMMARGRIGGVLAGLGFMLPGQDRAGGSLVPRFRDHRPLPLLVRLR